MAEVVRQSFAEPSLKDTEATGMICHEMLCFMYSDTVDFVF